MTNSMFADAIKRLETAATFVGLDRNVLEELRGPRRIFKARLKVARDDGRMAFFDAWRVQYSEALGPYKGGLRFHPSVDEDTLMALGFDMVMKPAIVDIPFGGAKGGVAVDPSKLSRNERELMDRAYVIEFGSILGSDKDIAAPDAGSNATDMGYMLNEMRLNRGTIDYAAITGKPLGVGGSLGREAATGRGGLYALLEHCHRMSLQPPDLTVAVQGFGNVGSWFAQLAAEAGFRVIAVSDDSGGVHNPDGLDIGALRTWCRGHSGRVAGFPNSSRISNDSLLTMEVDVLVPAALQNQLTGERAKRARCGLVLELANGPTTPEADEVFERRDIVVLPDIYANAGGIIVSYYEWVQNKEGDAWDEEVVNGRLHKKMTKAYGDIAAVIAERSVSFRLAAFVLALTRLETAILARGRF